MFAYHFSLLLSCYFVSVQCASAPLEIPFNKTHNFGSDGPWHAVPISLGDPAQIVHLYPGGTFLSWVPRADSRGDQATSDSFYDGTEGSSSQAYYNVTWRPDGAALGSLTRQKVQFTNISVILDEMTIPNPNHFAQNVNVPLFNMAIGDWNVTYPNGVTAPVEVGTFSLGTTSGVQGYGRDQGYDSDDVVEGTFPYQVAYDRNDITSRSWTLHSGSASYNVPGSFFMGGYDRSRVLGDVGTWDLSNGLNANILAVDFQTIGSNSPPPISNSSNLLVVDGQLSDSLQVTIEPASPYIYLPDSMCDAMAKDLPMQWNETLGFYIWNTEDPKFLQLNSTAAYFDFNLAKRTPGEKISIKVAIQLLMLSLESPIVENTVKYFPCKKSRTSDALLGRAFFQAAFLGSNWGSSTFWIAQAPGPNLSGVNYRNIEDDDTTIEGLETDYPSTWSTVWKGIKDISNKNGTNSDTENDSQTKAKSGLSGGAIAGIVVGAVVVIATAVAIAYFLWRRHLRRSAIAANAAYVYEETLALSDIKHSRGNSIEPQQKDTEPFKDARELEHHAVYEAPEGVRRADTGPRELP